MSSSVMRFCKLTTLRALLIGALAVFVLSGSADAQLSRLRVRGGASSGGSDDCSGCTLIQYSDFTYLGAIRLPKEPSGLELRSGKGFTYRREGTDGTDQLHFLVTAYPGPAQYHYYRLLEFRNQTPLIPMGGASAVTDESNYSDATLVANYGATSGDGDDPWTGADTAFKRLQIAQGIEGEFEASSGPDTYGLHVTQDNGRLYALWNGSYQADYDSWSLLYTVLNYGAATGAAVGPYRLSGHGSKAINNCMVDVPAWYATAYLGGKRQAVGCGGYGSQTATGGVSMGLTLAAIDTIASAEGSTLANTTLVGYGPYVADEQAGAGRQTRPSGMTSAFDSWALDKFGWTDTVDGAVWINEPSLGKHGVISFSTLAMGNTRYIVSERYSEKYAHYWFFWNPFDFAPASSTAAYDVQPTTATNVEYPVVDYAGVRYPGASKSYTSETKCTITSITKDGTTTAKNVQDSHSPLVTCAGAHGLSDGVYISIRDNSEPDYIGAWQIHSATSTTFRISYGGGGGLNWNGNTGAGGSVFGFNEGSLSGVAGVDYDPVLHRLYVFVLRASGFATSNDYPFVLVYQLN